MPEDRYGSGNDQTEYDLAAGESGTDIFGQPQHPSARRHMPRPDLCAVSCLERIMQFCGEELIRERLNPQVSGMRHMAATVTALCGDIMRESKAADDLEVPPSGTGPRERDENE